MNQQAADALVAAALRGTRQIQGNLADSNGGRCAWGVICEAFGVRFTSCGLADGYSGKIFDLAGMTSGEEWAQLLHANDVLGWDFLTIARKLGPKA